MKNHAILELNRRRALALIAGTGAAALLGPLPPQTVDAATACVAVAEQQTEGPYWVEEMLNRSDIRVDPSNGAISPGVLLTLAINVHEVTNTGCSALAGAHVDIWHCDAGGLYSDEAANSTVGRKFLRGYQITDDNGAVQFVTVYPGWYSGRTIHIHVRIRTYSGSQVYDVFTAQLFFDDSVTDQVFTQSPYSQRRARDTRNANDMVLTGTKGTALYLSLTKNALGYAASVDIGVNLKTVAPSKPVVTAGGVVSAASFQTGVAPGSWVTIFGQNLAASSHSLTASDLVDGKLPTSLSGVSVQIDRQPAFLSYVSPSQLNVQAPSDANLGPVSVTVTNSGGTSDSATATLQTYLPAFFTIASYVAAVRSDGVVVTGAVKPGDLLSLYGTGFGPTAPAVAPGALPSAAAPLANPAAITIGGVAAAVSFAGLAAAGLYQFNITVPNLTNGDYPVVAEIAGLRTQTGVLLKIQTI